MTTFKKLKESLRKAQKQVEGVQQIKVGPYIIKKQSTVFPDPQKHVIWIQNEDGEGMSIDVDQLFKERY